MNDRRNRSIRSDRRAALAGLLVVLVAALARADTVTWNTTTANWSAPNSWTPSEPTLADNAYINNGGTAQITAGNTEYADDLYLGRQAGQSGHVQMFGGALYVEHDEYIGYEGTGTFTQSGGENRCSYGVSNYDLHLGYASGGSGSYTLTGGSLYAGDEYIGRLGTGTFLHSGGANYVSATGSSTADNLYVGYATSSAWGSGTYRLEGTAEIIVSHKNADIYVGREYSSTISQGRFEWFRSGGITWSDPSGDGRMEFGPGGTLAMGYDFSSIPSFVTGLESATLEVTNGATLTKNNDGITSVVKYLRIGSETGDGDGIQNGGTVQIGQSATIGDKATGVATQHGGTFQVGTHLYLGVNSPTASGTYRLNGGTLSVGSNISTGAGAGALILDGGTLSLSGNSLSVTNLILGDQAGRTGQYTLGGSKTITALNLDLGRGGTGILTQSGGTVNATNLRFGQLGSGTGTYRLTGGVLNAGTVLDGPGSGVMEIDGGTLNPSGSVTIDILKVGLSAPGSHTQTAQMYTISTLTLGNATYRLAGGTLNVGQVLNTTGAGTLNLDGGTFVPSGSVNVDQLGVGIVSAGTHTQTAQTYTVGTLTLGSGTYTISAGTLSVGGAVINASGTGTLALDGGTFAPAGNVAVDQLQVGVDAPAAHTQSGGVYDVGAMTFGVRSGGQGTYLLAGGTLNANGGIALGAGSGTLVLNGGTLNLGGNVALTDLVVGHDAVASYAQSSRIFTLSRDLTVGSGSGNGTYRLADSGEFQAAGKIVIGSGTATGRFEWYRAGGLTTSQITLGNNGTLAMGHDFDADALLGAGGLVDGLEQATLELTRGAIAEHDDDLIRARVLRIGSADGGGTYRLGGAGELEITSAGCVDVGASGNPGRFDWHREGALSTPRLALATGSVLSMGFDFDTPQLLDGSLFGGTLSGVETATLEVTRGAAASQLSGSVKLGHLQLGAAAGAGTYRLRGGSLRTVDLIVGHGAEGTLSLEDPAALLEVAGTLVFGDQATLSAAPGSRITLIGSDVWNYGSDPLRLADLERATLAFEPSVVFWDRMELAGRDEGPVLQGFVENFALGTLQVGSVAGDRPAQLLLVDLVANQGGGSAEGSAEALYVHNLFVRRDSTLDLNGLNVYYDGILLNEGRILNGDPIYVPEPATWLLLALLAALGAASKRRTNPRAPGDALTAVPKTNGEGATDSITIK